MVDIVARAEPDLEDPPRQTAGQLGTPPPQSGSSTRSVHQYREDPLAVETHAARLASRRRRRSPEMARRWGSGPASRGSSRRQPPDDRPLRVPRKWARAVWRDKVKVSRALVALIRNGLSASCDSLVNTGIRLAAPCCKYHTP